MGYYKYVREIYKRPKECLGALWQQRLIQWRREPATIRIEHPTRIDRARSLGYKAKQGFLVVRQRVDRGGRQRPTIRKGRRSKAKTQRLDLKLSYQVVAEKRAGNHFPNCEVLNSYWIAKDGLHYWYEVILVDRSHPSILADKNIRWIANQRGRVERGLTSAAKKSRGLRGTGKGYEKARPSLRAHHRRHN